MKKIIGILLALALVLAFSLVATTPVAAAPPVTNGLVLHLDASDAGSITKDGANRVSQWADLSGNSNDAAQATLANQPLWVDNVLAGRPIIRFDGSDLLTLPNNLAALNSITAFIVSRHEIIDTTLRYTIAGSNAAGTITNRFYILGTTSGVHQGFSWSVQNQHPFYTTAGSTAWSLRGLRHGGNVAEAFLNGVMVGSTSETSTVTPQTWRIGSFRDDPRFNGDIAEILIYDRALSDGERQGVEQYLRVRWLGKCVTTATGTGSACLGVTHGDIEDLVARAAPSLPSVAFPHGMFSFKITGLNTGQTVTLTIELPDPVPVGTVWWKYDNGRWYSLPNLNDNGNNIMVIRLTDGGAGDSDGLKDGVITEPGGPGNPMTVGWETSPVSKPAVWAPWIALLAAIVAGAGLLVWRRRRAQT